MTLQQFVRCTIRTVFLFATLVACGIDAIFRRPRTLLQRAQWMQQWSRRLLRILRIQVQALDTPREAQAIVCNHLSYLDVLVLGAQQPTIFICKEEVRRWPLVGALVATAGSIFVNRNRARSLTQASEQMEAALREGVSVAFFPEATTSNGFTVLPFQPALYEPLVRLRVPVWCAYLSYRLSLDRHATSIVRERICYWGSMNFLRHLFHLTGIQNIEARLRFAHAPFRAADRKSAAHLCHRMIVAIAVSEQVPYAGGLALHWNRPVDGIHSLRANALRA